MAEDEKALLRYRIIAPLCDPDVLWGEKQNLLQELAAKIHQLPGGQERQFSVETIRHWYKLYKKKGFEGLRSNRRSDLGQCRALDQAVAQKACDLKQENPRRTLIKVIDILERENLVDVDSVKKSTLHRLFVQRQLTARVPANKAYWQRYQAEHSNDLWQSDQLHGPEIIDPKKPDRLIRAQLLAWLDDHSRVIAHAQFYAQAQLGALEHSLRRAIQKMGIPKLIYTDNGQIYSAKHLGVVCANLGIRLISATPYAPQGKGKIERFFGYVRSSFLTEVETTPPKTLEGLNQAFWAWLDLHYQNKIHSELQKTPLTVFLTHQERIRRASFEQLREAFLYRETRKVQKDCTFKLGSNYYEVMPALVKQEIEIQFDPDNLGEVKVYLAGTFFQQAKLLRMPPNRAKKETEQPAKVTTGIDYLDRLVKDHQQQQETALYGPVVTENATEFEPLKAMMTRLGFQLGEFCVEAVDRYDQTIPAVARPELEGYLGIIMALKGVDHHVGVYLELLTEMIQKGKLTL